MRRFGWVVAVAALAACPSEKKEVVDAGPPGPKQLTEKEPNDRPEQAQSITESSIVSASLTADPSKPDEDWYLLESPSPKTVDVTVSGIPGGDVMLEVYDQDRNRLVSVNSEGEGKPERIPNIGLKGKLYLRVTTAKRGAGGAYTLTALFNEVQPGFESEPNDRAADANPVALGQAIQGFIGHVADEDWYRFELPVPEGADAGTPADGAPDAAPAPEPAPPPAPSPAADSGAVAPLAAPPSIALRIELAALDGVRFDLSIMSAAEAQLFNVRGKEGEPLSLRNVGVRATDRQVYVVVKSAWIGTGKDAHRGYNPDKPYTLTVSQEEAGANAELEPNDDWQHATPLPLDGYREGFLSPKGDVDYYVLRANQPVLAHFELSGVERLDLELSLMKPSDNKEEELIVANDGAIKEKEILNDIYCANECYLRVRSASRKVDGKWVRDSENSEQPYRLTVSVLPDDGSREHESNNTPALATAITLGHPLRGTIQPKKDEDWFKLDLSARPVKTALRATLIGILKVHVGLYMYSSEGGGKPELVQTADSAKGDAPEAIKFTAEPGVYYFRVADTHKVPESNFQDSYQLTVEEAE
jgi:hypothetical protein